MFYTEIINNILQKTDEVILFHSATGKDSICLLDLLSMKFKKVVCVFMYIVKDLEYENKYIRWAEKKYPNCNFIKVPHYCLSSFIKHGYLGIKKDENIEGNKISEIDRMVRLKTGINFSVYGFKKNDGLTRRLMLNDCKNGIHPKTNKCYPIMDLKNRDVLNYIADNNLIPPFNYNSDKPSSGCDISQPKFLNCIRSKYPDDLKKIFLQFPFCEIILFKYDNYGIKTE
jgi:3'-phosphoadenosine 5'-phosphosulfate sulfotransferase (PAPS reductase)/FAD synthetase